MSCVFHTILSYVKHKEQNSVSKNIHRRELLWVCHGIYFFLRPNIHHTIQPHFYPICTYRLSQNLYLLLVLYITCYFLIFINCKKSNLQFFNLKRITSLQNILQFQTFVLLSSSLFQDLLLWINFDHKYCF